MKQVRISDFLTDDEIRRALKLYREDQPHFHERVLREIINPNMERINKALGQENDPTYLAYAVEFAIGTL